MKSFLSFFYIFLVSSATIFAVLRISVPAQTRDFSKEKARQIPSWIRDAVIYELNPRTFSQAGNFNGITERLDELKSLGVTIIWLMPVHPSGIEKKKGTIGSPYAVRDYYAVNPDYGSQDDFRRLITEAHKRGLKIIIDVVANHTSWDSVMMKDPGLYKRDAKGNILSPFDWSDVAALDYNNRELRKYMIEMLKFWLREFDLDGYRCDVAGLVPTDFWEEARPELEKVKKISLCLRNGISRTCWSELSIWIIRGFFITRWPTSSPKAGRLRLFGKTGRRNDRCHRRALCICVSRTITMRRGPSVISASVEHWRHQL
ncbi:MAG: hypothetical protein IPG76_24370 [Acidobacteria bacterium]|nr:hypothetical protein [Acidobacteriota bacterium]